MTNQSESQRIAELEGFRKHSTDKLIDQAIANGTSAGDVALNMLAEDRKSDENASEIAREIQELTLARNGRPLVTSQKKADTQASAVSSEYLSVAENATADGIIAEINALRK